MRKILFIICLLIGEGIALPVPAFRGLMKVRQPDGTEVTIYKRGDERSHKVYNQQGIELRQDSSGYWREAGDVLTAFEPQSRTGSGERRAERRSVITRGPGLFHYAFPVKGKQKGLVILVEFKDVKFNSKNSTAYKQVESKTYFTEMLNKEGFDTYGGTGSARDWFISNSNGQFEPEFDVFGPVTLPQNMKYYGGNDYYGEDKKPHEMVIDACKLLDEEIDYKEYDRDGDGYVDNVYVFYAGYGEADTYESNAVWPHSWSISDATGSVFSPGEPLLLDGVYVDSYACSNETQGYNDYGVLANRPCGIGTFVHEFSHVMGLPDLYSTNYENTDPDKEPFTPGEYSIMDYGPYNNGGLTPPNYSAYERYAFDWVVPEEIKVGEYELKNLQDSNKVLMVSTDKDDEFFLFENRQNVSWDKYIPGHGMLVWHVDFNRNVFYNNEVNNTRAHQYVDIVEADDVQDYPIKFNSSYGFFEYGASTQSGDPFPGTSKVTSFGESTSPALKSWSGKGLGLDLTDITEKDGVITFRVSEANTSSVSEISTPTNLTGDLYNLNGVLVGKANGTLPTLAPGIYILKGDGKTVKLRI